MFKPLFVILTQKWLVARSFYSAVPPKHRLFHSQRTSNSIENTLTGRFNRYIINLHPDQSKATESSAITETLSHLNSCNSVTTALLTKYDRCGPQVVANTPHSELLALMVGWSRHTGTRVHQLQTYGPAMERLCASYESRQPKGDFLTICHLLGSAKKHGNSAKLLDAFMRRHFNKYADSMSTIELAIVAAALYRTAIRVQANHGRHFERAILQMNQKDDSDEERLDIALLVTFVKTLRLARIRSERVADLLSKSMHTGRLKTANDDRLQFRHLAHFFTFYASNRFNDPATMRWLTQQAMCCINEDYEAFRGKRSPIDMRGKDFGMILWSMAQLNVQHYASAVDLQRICTILKEKITDGEFRRDFDGLVDVAMSLWMMGLRSRALIDALFGDQRKDGAILIPLPSANRVKLESRKRLLLCCVQLERPDWFERLRIDDRRCRADVFVARRSAKPYLLRNANNLLHIQQLLQQSVSTQLNTVSLVQSIREINIPGLLLDMDDNRQLFVEVQEEHTTLSDSTTPFGLLQLKLRLLQTKGQHVVLVNPLVQSDDEITTSISAAITSIRTEIN